MATDGVSFDSAQLAMEQISAVVDNSFIYRRWSDEKGRYLKWPRSDSEFRLFDINDEEQLADSLARLRR
jgi:hypothetical protein